MVKASMDTSTVQGTQMYKLSKMLKTLKPVLRTRNKNSYQRIHKRVEDARAELLQIQKEVLTNNIQSYYCSAGTSTKVD